MSALPVSGIIFILTSGGILLGALTRHVLAGRETTSGALPPGFPAVEIEGEH
jgi:hypothetical protein